jgi:ornithine cyclodeaminase/alanine dehydrogenase-like protein (mu-crystallin family)
MQSPYPAELKTATGLLSHVRYASNECLNSVEAKTITSVRTTAASPVRQGTSHQIVETSVRARKETVAASPPMNEVGQ